MSAVYKFLGQEIAISSANTVSLSKVIRVTNTTNGLAVLQLANGGGANTANTTLAPYEVLVVEKGTTETVAGTGLKAVPIAYRN